MTRLKRNIRSSQGLPEAVGFSMLPHSHSAIAITNRLTGSQFRLWHYLMMIDPFADQTRNGEKIYHPIPSPSEIAVAIGASQRTVEKDMKRLEELGLYAKRITQWEGYNTTAEAGKAAALSLKNKSSVSPEPLQDKGGYLTADAAKQPDVALNSRAPGYLTADAAKQPDVALNSRKQRPEPLQDKGGYLTADPAKQPDVALNSRAPGYLTADPAKQPDVALNSRKQRPEPSPDKASKNPQTIQTYSDFIRSLSDSERENFLDFGLKKAAQLPKEPELPLKWIKANFEELKELWLKEQEHSNCVRANSTSSTSSTKVQNFDLWESSSHQGQYHTLMSLGLAKFCENRISKSWYEWAKAKYPEKFIDIPL